MSHYTMLYKYGKQTRDFGPGVFILVSSNFLYSGGTFNKTIIPLALVEMRSNARSWNNC